jgi:hypothetical protein
MVWVPDVMKLNTQAAEEKLKAAGLGVGLADRKVSNKYELNTIMSQNPRAGKHVNRDTLVNLEISDGPDPNAPIAEPEPTTDSGGQENANGAQPNPNGIGAQPDQSTEPDSTDTSPRFFDLKIKIKRDHKGDRQVRVEYDDAKGTHTPINEMHSEGDDIRKQVDVSGNKITIRVYYEPDPNPIAESTRTLPRSPRGR